MKLYHHPMSNNCRRVLATIYHNQRQDVELVEVDLMQGQHKQPEFLALNPNAKVPVLVDGDFTLWESTAIMQYLASDSPLWPASKARYDITRWQVWAVAHLGPPLGKLVHERLLKKMTGGGLPDEQQVALALEGFARFAGVLEGYLAGRDYLVGDSLSLADFSVASDIAIAGPAGVELTDYPQIRRWYDRIEQLEAWKRSAPPPLG